MALRATGPYQEVMRYWAKLMLTGVPVIVTWRSLVPSSWLPILIWAPDTCLISLILVPWRPMIEPISCKKPKVRQICQSDHVDIQKRTEDMLYEDIVQWTSDWTQPFLIVGYVILMKAIMTKRAKSKTLGKKVCSAAELTSCRPLQILQLHCLSSVEWSSIMQVKTTFLLPWVSLNCYCVCTGKRDERRHICLSLIWVGKRLLIPQSGDDFPNKSLPKHMPARYISALMENIMGK